MHFTIILNYFRMNLSKILLLLINFQYFCCLYDREVKGRRSKVKGHE
jgi:hypothetical protein